MCVSDSSRLDMIFRSLLFYSSLSSTKSGQEHRVCVGSGVEYVKLST